MTRRAAWLIGVMGLMAACDDPHTEPEATEPAHDEREEAAAVAHAPNMVRIRPDMLRDLHITTAPAEERSSGEGVTALGEVRVNESAYAEVGAAISARVVRVLASAGERVAIGQPLIVLQSVEVGRARANLLGAQADATLARSTLERRRQLAQDRVVPPRELQEATAAAAAADSNLNAAHAALNALGVSPGAEDLAEHADGSTLTLRAPIAGTVVERDAVMGRTADPARALFRIADLSRLWLTVHVFERDALRVRAGATARLTFPALPGQTFSGTVSHVGLQVDTDSRTIPVRVDFDNVDALLRPGMSATAWLPLDEGGQLLIAVPAAALQRLADGWTVFVPHGESQFEIRMVGRGRDLGGEVEILNGVRAGEVVVVEGAFLLKAEAEKSRGEGEHHHD